MRRRAGLPLRRSAAGRRCSRGPRGRSHRHHLVEDSPADERPQALPRNEIDAHAELARQLVLKGHDLPANRAIELHQEIEIAVGALLAADPRPENAEIGDGITLAEFGSIARSRLLISSSVRATVIHPPWAVEPTDTSG